MFGKITFFHCMNFRWHLTYNSRSMAYNICHAPRIISEIPYEIHTMVKSDFPKHIIHSQIIYFSVINDLFIPFVSLHRLYCANFIAQFTVHPLITLCVLDVFLYSVFGAI